MKLLCLSLLAVVLATAGTVHAQAINRRNALPADFAPLDPPYENLIHPKKGRNRPLNREELKSNSAQTISYQTPVKSQGGRGTCSIFSATAFLEGALVRTQGFNKNEDDLSEEWLEYLAMQGKTTDGSHSTTNMRLLQQWGTVREATWPYVGEDWSKSPTIPAAKALCGRFAADFLRHASCLLGYRDPFNLNATDAELKSSGSDTYDPQFAKVRAEAQLFKDKFLKGRLGATTGVYNTDEIKALLRAGHTLFLDHDVFYGAYNHRLAGDDQLQIGRNMDHWAQGLIGYPHPNSLDVVKSKAKPAGHSVLVVGYDDTRSITVTFRTKGGGTQTYTTHGVYYVKNSWGQDSFGSQFQIDGVTYPGYGAFSQEYAHEHGAFYKVTIK